MSKLSSASLNIDEMDKSQLKEVIKMLVRLQNFESDRVHELQKRILALEHFSRLPIDERPIEAVTEPA